MNRAVSRDEGKPLRCAVVSSLGEVATRRVLFGMCNHVRKVELVSVPRPNKCQRTTGCNFWVSFWASAERVQC